jgi:hypothetical protein
MKKQLQSAMAVLTGSHSTRNFLPDNSLRTNLMATLGKHCKAFPLHQLRQFPAWTENRENARKIRTEIDGETVERERELRDSDYLYLQEDYTVTDGIFIDENVIFSSITSAWIDFCRSVLRVQFPPTASVSPLEVVDQKQPQDQSKTPDD